MDVRLIKWEDVEEGWQIENRVFLLVINDRSEVLSDLNVIKRDRPNDYKALLVTVQMFCERKTLQNPKRMKTAKNYKGVYELKGGSARLFFFRGPSGSNVAVCTNLYYKTKSSPAEQNQAFKKCHNLMRGCFQEIKWPSD